MRLTRLPTQPTSPTHPTPLAHPTPLTHPTPVVPSAATPARDRAGAVRRTPEARTDGELEVGVVTRCAFGVDGATERHQHEERQEGEGEVDGQLSQRFDALWPPMLRSESVASHARGCGSRASGDGWAWGRRRPWRALRRPPCAEVAHGKRSGESRLGTHPAMACDRGYDDATPMRGAVSYYSGVLPSERLEAGQARG